MKGKLLIMTVMLIVAQNAGAQASFEQYAYLEKNKTSTWVSLVQYKSSKKWIAEARYNYEANRAFSLYIGKTFSHKQKLSYSVTPLLGGVIGEFRGGSTGLNLTLDYSDVFFSCQSQYTFSGDPESLNFFFSWSELVYQAKHWIYFGLSAQQVYFNEISKGSFEPGIVVGFEIRKWTFPFYGFNLTDKDRYFVAGVNFCIGKDHK